VINDLWTMMFTSLIFLSDLWIQEAVLFIFAVLIFKVATAHLLGCSKLPFPRPHLRSLGRALIN